MPSRLDSSGWRLAAALRGAKVVTPCPRDDRTEGTSIPHKADYLILPMTHSRRNVKPQAIIMCCFCHRDQLNTK